MTHPAIPRAVRNGRVVRPDEMTLPVTSTAVRHGLGAFETVGVRGGKAFLLGAHALRLVASLSRAGWPCPWHPRTVFRWGSLAVGVAGRNEGVLRLIASPHGPTLFAWVDEAAGRDDGAARAGGLRATVRPAPRAPGSPLAGLKTLSWADHARIRDRARAEGFDEVLLAAPDGALLEGTGANLFLVENHGLVTPPAGEDVLPGVTRSLVSCLAPGLSLPLTIEPVSLPRLLSAGEAFLTNTLIGVAALVEVNGCPIGDGRPGPVTSRLRASWWRLAQCTRTGEDAGEEMEERPWAGKSPESATAF